MSATLEQVRAILPPELLLKIHRLKFPWHKNEPPSGAAIGQHHFRPGESDQKAFYDLVFHNALVPLSKISLDELLSIDLTQVLPEPEAANYPEQCLGLVILLDQTRGILTGYNKRYTKSFFDPICENLVKQFIAMPGDFRPDGKGAWIERDYTFEEWIVRTFFFWAPLVHSEQFMIKNREDLKEQLQTLRSNVRSNIGMEDPFAHLEASDDKDILAFKRVLEEGPPMKSYEDPSKEATIGDYAFYRIRISNAHFAITDTYGHYPYWVRWKGKDLTNRDKEFFQKSDNFQYDPSDDLILDDIRQDVLNSVWKPLAPNPKFEGGAS